MLLHLWHDAIKNIWPDPNATGIFSSHPNCSCFYINHPQNGTLQIKGNLFAFRAWSLHYLHILTPWVLVKGVFLVGYECNSVAGPTMIQGAWVHGWAGAIMFLCHKQAYKLGHAMLLLKAILSKCACWQWAEIQNVPGYALCLSPAVAEWLASHFVDWAVFVSEMPLLLLFPCLTSHDKGKCAVAYCT